MARPKEGTSRTEREPVFDDNGVDRTQIRRLLASSPRERLQQLQDFMDSVEEIRRLNGVRPLR